MLTGFQMSAAQLEGGFRTVVRQCVNISTLLDASRDGAGRIGLSQCGNGENKRHCDQSGSFEFEHNESSLRLKAEPKPELHTALRAGCGYLSEGGRGLRPGGVE